MAAIMNLGNETDIKWLINVSYPVGRAGPNRRDDVLLVQSFLNMLMPCFQLQDPVSGKRLQTYLRLDGFFGPRTGTAIVAYQRNVRSRGGLVSTDGQVDPSLRSGWTNSKDSYLSTQFTIVWMNRDYRATNRGKMASEDDFVPELRAALLANKIL